MRIIKQSWDWEQKPDGKQVIGFLEKAGNTCYKSDAVRNYEEKCEFVKGMVKKGHFSIIEHCFGSIRIISNRGFTHELVRHRLASYTQESTRYANYSKNRFGNEISVILPVWLYGDYEKSLVDLTRSDIPEFFIWKKAMEHSEQHYMNLLDMGWVAQQARDVLPIGLKTEIVTTCNLREWRHIFTMRCASSAAPQIRAMMLDILKQFALQIPVVFDDLVLEFIHEPLTL